MKVWVDANVILRLLTGEPEEMASSAQTLFQRAERGELTLHLSTLVTAEVARVLGSYYRIPRPRIAEVVTQVAMAEGVECEQRGLLVDALALMAEENVDLVDAYLARLASSDDGAVASFDRDLARLPGRHLHPDDVGT
jgi:predicted nucleic acid-binding protein